MLSFYYFLVKSFKVGHVSVFVSYVYKSVIGVQHGHKIFISFNSFVNSLLFVLCVAWTIKTPIDVIMYLYCVFDRNWFNRLFLVGSLSKALNQGCKWTEEDNGCKLVLSRITTTSPFINSNEPKPCSSETVSKWFRVVSWFEAFQSEVS